MMRIGIRELRQNATAYIRLVQAGAHVEITNRGQAVALLVPIASVGLLEELEARGRLTPDGGDVLELGPPLPSVRGAPTASQTLARSRDDER